jgi:hypothetical protein
MTECSNLATKADLAALEGRYIPKVEKEGIINKASAIGASIAVATLDPRVQALLKELAQLASKLGTLATRVLDLFGKLAGILSIIGLLATQAQLLILHHDVQRLKSQLKQVSDIAENAVYKSDLAIAKADAATNIANIATNNAYKAIDKANQAINEANTAGVKSEQARSAANQAIVEANFATTAANKARNEANQASREANQARSEANVAKSQANQAIGEANEAKREAKGATTTANAATAKADEAIRISNQNAALIEQVNNDNKHLRAELFGIKFAQSLIPSEAERRNIELEERFNGKLKVLTVNGVTKEYVVRTAAEGRAAQERDAKEAKERDKALEDIIKSGDAVSLTEAQVSKMIADGIKQEDKSIRDWVLGLPGIGATPGTKDNGLTVGQVKDIARTETAKQVKELERVQDRQYSDLRDRVGALPGVIGGVVVGGIVTGIKPFGDSINKTVAQTSAPAITQAAAAGVCQTTKPGGCMNNLSNNQGQNIRDYINAAGTAASAANNALLLQMQGILNALKATTDIIKSTTDAISKTVHHAGHGLAAVQKFAATAWNATQADKVLSLVNTALNIHNAVMLSNNIGRSMAYIANNTLQAFGVTDSTTGLPIDVGSIVKNKLNSMINSMLGATQANALRRQLAGYNRIYQAGANVLWSVRSIMDSAYDIAETTGENVSQIGNALKKAGAVRENAYKLMPTDFRSTSRVQRRLEKIGNVADSLEQISGDAVSLTEEVKEMKSNQKEFQDELKKATDEQTKIEDAKKKEALNNPEHKPEDEIRAIPKEETK